MGIILYPGIQFRLPCTPPRTIFHGCQIVYWDPLNEKLRCPQKKFGFENCMVSMATNSEFEKGGLPTKLLVSQLLLILDY